jgi:hypothetical protein
LIISRAPPPPSSAGWKDQVHSAVKVALLSQILRRSQQHGGVAVVAAGVHLAGCWLAWAKVLNSCMGSASMSARRPMARSEVPALTMPTTPVVPKPRWTGMPHSSQLGRHQVGRAALFKTQLGVGMDVAANGRNAGAGIHEVVNQIHTGVTK